MLRRSGRNTARERDPGLAGNTEQSPDPEALQSLVDDLSVFFISFPSCCSVEEVIEFSLPFSAIDSIDQEETFLAKPSCKIPIPDIIKALLVDDWENVTKSQQLVPLPHEHAVNEILADYVAVESANREPNSAAMDLLDEVVSGIKEYFDKCIGRILLYR